jgi:nitrate reductase delta subunit
MAKTFKVLSALLSYPTQELQDACEAFPAVLLEEGMLSPEVRGPLENLISEIASADLYELQERYIELFDRGRTLSLYLFEHVHGESRDRGQAMIDLKSLYESRGLRIGSNELPDFLPLFLEFLSTLPVAEAREHLAQTAHILAMLGERLGKRNSPYRTVLNALYELTGEAPSADSAEPAPPGEADGSDLAALDAQWEEEPVTFGPEAQPSCKDRLASRIRAARRPAPGLTT